MHSMPLQHAETALCHPHGMMLLAPARPTRSHSRGLPVTAPCRSPSASSSHSSSPRCWPQSPPMPLGRSSSSAEHSWCVGAWLASLLAGWLAGWHHMPFTQPPAVTCPPRCGPSHTSSAHTSQLLQVTHATSPVPCMLARSSVCLAFLLSPAAAGHQHLEDSLGECPGGGARFPDHDHHAHHLLR